MNSSYSLYQTTWNNHSLFYFREEKKTSILWYPFIFLLQQVSHQEITPSAFLKKNSRFQKQVQLKRFKDFECSFLSYPHGTYFISSVDLEALSTILPEQSLSSFIQWDFEEQKVISGTKVRGDQKRKIFPSLKKRKKKSQTSVIVDVFATEKEWQLELLKQKAQVKTAEKEQDQLNLYTAPEILEDENFAFSSQNPALKKLELAAKKDMIHYASSIIQTLSFRLTSFLTDRELRVLKNQIECMRTLCDDFLTTQDLGGKPDELLEVDNEI